MELKPKVLLFDLDQTLLKSSKLLHLMFTIHFCHKFYVAGISFFKLIPFLNELKKSLRDNFTNQLTNEERAFNVAKQFGLEQDRFQEIIKEIFETVLNLFKPMSDSEDLFFLLKPHYQMVLATNPVWPQTILELRLARGRIRIHDFSFITHAGNMKSTKYSSNYYRELLEKLQVKASDCLMIGDSIKKDGIANQVNIPVFLLHKKYQKVHALLSKGTIDHLRAKLLSRKASGIVVNYRSQNGFAKKKWNQINSLFDSIPVFTLQEKTEEKDLLLWLKKIHSLGGENILICGGDGTVNWILNLIYKNDLNFCLGFMGLGSSNDYHKPYSLSRFKFQNIPMRAEFDQGFDHDSLEIYWNHKHVHQTIISALNGSVGAIAYGNALFSKSITLRKISISMAILFSALKALIFFKAIEVQYKIDDNEWKTCKIFNLSFYKNRHFSGDFKYENEIKADSQNFGWVLFPQQNILMLFKIFYSLLKGKISHLSYVHFGQGKNLEIKATIPFQLEVDGEVYLVDRVHVTIGSKKVRLCP